MRWPRLSSAPVSNSRPQAAKFIDSRVKPRSPSASAAFAIRNSVMPLGASGSRCIRSSDHPGSAPKHGTSRRKPSGCSSESNATASRKSGFSPRTPPPSSIVKPRSGALPRQRSRIRFSSSTSCGEASVSRIRRKRWSRPTRVTAERTDFIALPESVNSSQGMIASSPR